MRLIWSYVRPYLKKMTGGVIMKFIGTVSELLLPWLLTYILTDCVPKAREDGPGVVYLWGGIMLLASAAALVFNVLANRNASAVARDSTRALRHDLFRKITLLKSSEIDRFTVPSLISRMTTDTYYVYRMTGMMQRIGIRAPILLLGGILITMAQDAVLSSMLLVLLPFMGLCVAFVSKKGVPLYDRVQQNADRLVRIVRENLSGLRIIKALSKTEDEKRRFDEVNRAVAASETKAAAVMGVNSPTMQFLLNMGLVLVVWLGALRARAGLTQAAQIIAFLQYFTLILNAMMTITRVVTLYSKAVASAGRIREVMDGEEETSPDVPCAFEQKVPHICFEHVTFSYNKHVPNVKDVSFSLMKGQTLGILGPTGSGKSTLIRLLLRFYDPDEGRILLWGHDLRDISLSSLRSRFGAVFRGTAGENITLGRPLSREALDAAVRDAQAEEYLNAKQGLETEVTSRGQNLSGGQLQRLLLSRAFAGDPEILILDDSSSALDFGTEKRLRGALEQNYPGTTKVIIAQRISAVMHCDLILVMDDGCMNALGTHEELLRSCPLYREIAAIQLGGDA